MAVKFEAPPAIGHKLAWSGRQYVLTSVGVGMLYGRTYPKLTWRSACADCGGGFEQTSPLGIRRLAARCKACDPAGEKDAADRRAFIASRGSGRTAAAKAFELVAESAKLVPSQGASIVIATVAEDGGEPYAVTWKPGGVPLAPEYAALDALLAAEHARLSAAEAML